MSTRRHRADDLDESVLDVAASLVEELDLDSARTLAKRLTQAAWVRKSRPEDVAALVLGRFDIPWHGLDYPTVGVMLMRRPTQHAPAAAVLVMVFWHGLDECWAVQDILGPQTGKRKGEAPEIPWAMYQGNWMGEPSCVNGDFSWRGRNRGVLPRTSPPSGEFSPETTAAPGEESVPGAGVRSWRSRLGALLRRWADRLTSRS